jgi:cellulose synthase/poly-beta-1,6-N-acetylglucosamine synthase-like glycosyltransferase
LLQSVTVTVGLCVKNASSLIKKALNSLIAQTFPPQELEVILVDGNSSDDTLRIAQKMLQTTAFRVRMLKENSGLGFARQIVVEQTRGKYIVWLDADMTLPKDYIANQVHYMETHPRVAIAAGRYNVHIGYGFVADMENIVYAVDSVYGQQENSKLGYLPGAEGAIYRVEAVRGVGGFDTDINGAAEDTEVAFRVRASGWELATTEEKFTESTRMSWRSLWNQYVWYGRGAHYIFHKDPASVIVWKLTPLGGFMAGILRCPWAYLMTHKKSFFLLPVHYTYKRFAWLFGFCDAHLNGYGHNPEKLAD